MMDVEPCDVVGLHEAVARTLDAALESQSDTMKRQLLKERERATTDTLTRLPNREALDERLEGFPGLFLTGNAFFGVGLNDCVHSSNQITERVIGYLQSRPAG